MRTGAGWRRRPGVVSRGVWHPLINCMRAASWRNIASLQHRQNHHHQQSTTSQGGEQQCVALSCVLYLAVAMSGELDGATSARRRRKPRLRSRWRHEKESVAMALSAPPLPSFPLPPFPTPENTTLQMTHFRDAKVCNNLATEKN